MPTLQQVIAQRKRKAEAETGTIRGMIIEILPDILDELLDKAKPELVERLAPIVKSDVIERLKVKGEPGTPGRPGKDAQPLDEDKVVERVRALIPTPKDGKDADEDVITRRVLAKIPTPKNGKDAVIEHEKITKQVIETLKEKKLKPEHIDGLGEMMEGYWKKVRAQSKSGIMRGGGDTVVAGTGITITRDSVGRSTIAASGGTGGTPVYGENLSSQAPGTSFTLANIPQSGTLRLYRGGSRQSIGALNDYTLSGAVITFNNSVSVGEIIEADYVY